MRNNGGKRKRRERPTIHPRNRYADNTPDFALLASLYSSFSPFVFYSRDNRPRIDWTDFNATRELTKVLLHHDHGLNWYPLSSLPFPHMWIPDGHLCPTVPNRSNYIHWIEDLVASDIIEKKNAEGDVVRGFDIGTGANCIYPLLGASLLGWSFVGSDMADVALEWAEKNVQNNPHIAHLIEIRRAENAAGVFEGQSIHTDITSEEIIQSKTDLLDSGESKAVDNSGNSYNEKSLDDSRFNSCEGKAKVSEMNNEDSWTKPPVSLDDNATLDENYNGPPVLLGVVKDGEKFDFCMCNPPFFESMEEAGQNPKTSCGGTREEMVCTGGERAFVSRIIEDSVALRQSFRWYTTMLGKKSNLKLLTSKLRKVGVTIVKTTEFVQGQTCRWGLAWSFMSPTRKLVPSALPGRSNFSFMLEGLHRQVSAFSILQSTESLFCSLGASCKSNLSSFTVDVTASNSHWDLMLENENKDLNSDANCQRVAKVTCDSGSLDDPSNHLCLRISVFQQIPGTLLVKGLLQPRNGPSMEDLEVFSSKSSDHRYIQKRNPEVLAHPISFEHHRSLL
ncbi:hypothetical protein V2J09_003151 [Rumex salicifolius]